MLLVLLVLLVLVTGTAGYVFAVRGHDEATSTSSPLSAIDVATGRATLPDLRFDRPRLTSATWTETETYLHLDETGAMHTENQVIVGVADYSSSITRLDVTDSRSPGINTIIYTPTHSYARSTNLGWDWSRFTRKPARSGAIDQPDYLPMYQDVVTSSTREDATDIEMSTEIVDGLTLTTYSFTVDTVELAERVEGTVPGESVDVLVGTMEVTVDEFGQVRRWHIELAEGLARVVLPSIGRESMWLSTTVEVSSLNEPVDITPPTEFVDQTDVPKDGS